jgi:hypothetical protein
MQSDEGAGQRREGRANRIKAYFVGAFSFAPTGTTLSVRACLFVCRRSIQLVVQNGVDVASHTFSGPHDHVGRRKRLFDFGRKSARNGTCRQSNSKYVLAPPTTQSSIHLLFACFGADAGSFSFVAGCAAFRS